MKKENISNVIGHISDKYLIEAMDGIDDIMTDLPHEETRMRNRKVLSFRKIVSIAAAACLVMASGIIVYATNLFGIRDMLSRQGIELSESASKDIVTYDNARSDSQNGWKASVKESLYEGGNVILTVLAECEDQYLLAPTDASPDDMYNDTETFAQYAAENNRTILFIGASLTDDQLNISVTSQDFHRISDNELEILINASTTGGSDKVETTCEVHAREDGHYQVEDVQRVYIPFTLVQGKSSETAWYKPDNADALDSVHVSDAELISTPLGTEFLITLNGAGAEKIGRVTYGESSDASLGMVFGQLGEDKDSTWGIHCLVEDADIGDSFTLYFYGVDDSLIGTVTFRK